MRLASFAGVIVVIAALPCPARGQHIEAAGGLAVPLAQDAQTYTSRYEPSFRYVTHSGTAAQQLQVEPSIAQGVWGSVAWFPHRRAGVEFRTAFTRVPLDGVNGPYEISLAYQTRQPPDYVLREYHLARSTAWPPTEGRLDHLSLAGSVVGVVGRPRGLALRLSGGVAMTAVSGYFESLGYTTYTLGGHAVVFPNEYTLRMSAGRTWSAGFEAAAEAMHALGRHVALTAGIRTWIGPATKAKVSVGEVRGDIAIQPAEPADVNAVLSPPPLQWRPAPVTVVAGLRIGRF